MKWENQYEYWLDTLPFYKNIHEQGMVVNDEKIKKDDVYFICYMIERVARRIHQKTVML